jgi:hypothetical protein
MATTSAPPLDPIRASAQDVGQTRHAFAEHVGNLPSSIPSDKGILYTEVRRRDGSISRVAVEVNKTGCGCNEKQMGISPDLMKRVEEAVQKTNVFVRADRAPAPIIGAASGIPPAATGISHVRINFTSLRVLYEVNGEEESKAIKDIEDVALRTLLLDIGKDIAPNATTDPSISSNRPLNRSTPMEINTPQWHNAHRISAETYSKRDHHELDASFRRDLGDETADRALPKIKAAELFVTKFREQLEAKLRDKKAELTALPSQDRGARLALKRQIHQLEELLAKADAQKLDMKAIYTSVPYAKNDLAGLSLDEQMQRANLSQQAMQYSLTMNQESLGKPGAAFITAYAQDKGDLLIHDRWKYEERVDDRGGEKRGPSVEEFVVFNILNLNNIDESVLDEAISSLALPMKEAGDEELHAAVRDALQAARSDTRDSYKADLARLGTTKDLAAQTQILYPPRPPSQPRVVSGREAAAMSRP